MLTYLIQTTEQLIAAAVMIGLLAALSAVVFGEKRRLIPAAGAVLGVAAALVMAYLKIHTSKIDTGMWNLRIFAVNIAAFLGLVICMIVSGIRKRSSYIPHALFTALILALLLFYALPDYFNSPHTIVLSEGTLLSTAAMVKLIGILLGSILVLVAGLSVYKGAVRLGGAAVFALVCATQLVNTVRQLGSMLSVLLARRMIASNHTLFVLAKNSANYSNVYIYLTLLAALAIPVMLLLRRLRADEPYENTAQRRKIIAKWRRIRRWSVTLVVCLVLVVLNMTAVNAYANRAVELSPIEDAVTDEENVYVSFDQVSDGHLHRFGYTTESGTVIRFIVIQKPNSSSYGIGLDACDICGETGYYEKNGQVVCNLCDVVMNINTIGFKGGCNPIVIDYTIRDGQIIVPIEGLLAYEVEFTR